MPAAAVIPAPIAYIKVVAVKKLVVEPWVRLPVPLTGCTGRPSLFLGVPACLYWGAGPRSITLKKLECSKQAFARIH